MRPGRIRLLFRLYYRARQQIGAAPTALYVARGLDMTAHGPYRVSFQRIAGERKHKTNAGRDRSRKWVYLARLHLRRPGTYAVVALIRLDNRLLRSSATSLTLLAKRHR